MGGRIAGRGGAFIVSLMLVGIPLGSGEAAQYHSPLAGEPLHTVIMGKPLDIPALDRGHLTALILGGEYYFPKQGDTSGTPIGALYLKRVWENSRTRYVISIFVNDLEYDRSFGNLELVTRFENHTLPGGQREVVNNREIKSSDALWGTVIASVGPGLRYKVAPFQVDNDLRLQLLGKVGYFYAERTSDTGPNLVLPPDTMLYGVKLRGVMTAYAGICWNSLIPAWRPDSTWITCTGTSGPISAPSPTRSSPAKIQGITSSRTAISWVLAEFRGCRKRTGFSSASTAALLPGRAQTVSMPSQSVAALFPANRMTSAAPIIPAPCSTRFS